MAGSTEMYTSTKETIEYGFHVPSKGKVTEAYVRFHEHKTLVFCLYQVYQTDIFASPQVKKLKGISLLPW